MCSWQERGEQGECCGWSAAGERRGLGLGAAYLPSPRIQGQNSAHGHPYMQWGMSDSHVPWGRQKIWIFNQHMAASITLFLDYSKQVYQASPLHLSSFPQIDSCLTPEVPSDFCLEDVSTERWAHQPCRRQGAHCALCSLFYNHE